MMMEERVCASCQEGFAEDNETECFECLHKPVTATGLGFTSRGHGIAVTNRRGEVIAVVDRLAKTVTVELNAAFLNPDRLELEDGESWYVRFELPNLQLAGQTLSSACQSSCYATTLWSRSDIGISESTFGIGWDVIERMNQYLARVARECVAVAFGPSSAAGQVRR